MFGSFPRLSIFANGQIRGRPAGLTAAERLEDIFRKLEEI